MGPMQAWESFQIQKMKDYLMSIAPAALLPRDPVGQDSCYKYISSTVAAHMEQFFLESTSDVIHLPAPGYELRIPSALGATSYQCAYRQGDASFLEQLHFDFLV